MLPFASFIAGVCCLLGGCVWLVYIGLTWVGCWWRFCSLRVGFCVGFNCCSCDCACVGLFVSLLVLFVFVWVCLVFYLCFVWGGCGLNCVAYAIFAVLVGFLLV